MKEFSHRERILAAMEMQKPDRVPLMCQFSFGFMLKQLKISPVEFWFDAEYFAEGLVRMREIFDFDGILVSLHGHKKDWKNDILEIKKEDETEVVYFEDRKMIFVPDDLPITKYFGKKPVKNISQVSHSDIPGKIEYIPVSNNLHFCIDEQDKFRIFDLIYASVKDEFSIHGEVTSPFDYFLDLLGHQQGLTALIDDPEKCKVILQKFTDGIIQLAGGMCEKKIDAVKISSPFAGKGFISPGFYREFILPYESQIISTVKDEGKFVYLHTCGHIGDRLELMRDSGASGIECLDPPPVGDVELSEAFGRIGNDMFIKGNIDSVNVLLRGTEAEMISDVKNRIETGKNGKGFILSTACSIAPNVHKDRIKVLYELVNEFGRY
ncbi:uroporphyrinogen decarboxylase family protein [candidate division KSB1 bacterium]